MIVFKRLCAPLHSTLTNHHTISKSSESQHCLVAAWLAWPSSPSSGLMSTAVVPWVVVAQTVMGHRHPRIVFQCNSKRMNHAPPRCYCIDGPSALSPAWQSCAPGFICCWVTGETTIQFDKGQSLVAVVWLGYPQRSASWAQPWWIPFLFDSFFLVTASPRAVLCWILVSPVCSPHPSGLPCKQPARLPRPPQPTRPAAGAWSHHLPNVRPE